MKYLICIAIIIFIAYYIFFRKEQYYFSSDPQQPYYDDLQKDYEYADDADVPLGRHEINNDIL